MDYLLEITENIWNPNVDHRYTANYGNLFFDLQKDAIHRNVMMIIVAIDFDLVI